MQNSAFSIEHSTFRKWPTERVVGKRGQREESTQELQEFRSCRSHHAHPDFARIKIVVFFVEQRFRVGLQGDAD